MGGGKVVDSCRSSERSEEAREGGRKEVWSSTGIVAGIESGVKKCWVWPFAGGRWDMIEVGEERKRVREDCCRAVEGREVEKDKSGIRGGGVGRGDIRDCFRGWFLGCAFGFLVEGSEREFEAAETEPLLERRASRSVSREVFG